MIWFVMVVSRHSLTPDQYDAKEYWTWKPVGEKPWIFRIFSRNRVWRDGREPETDSGYPLPDDGQSGISSAHRQSAAPSPDHEKLVERDVSAGQLRGS